MAKDGNKSSLRKPNVCPETPEETGATINKNIACSICKKKIVLASFNRHIEETHGNPRLKNCEICSYKTTRNHHLKRHIDAKHQNKNHRPRFGLEGRKYSDLAFSSMSLAFDNAFSR